MEMTAIEIAGFSDLYFCFSDIQLKGKRFQNKIDFIKWTFFKLFIDF